MNKNARFDEEAKEVMTSLSSVPSLIQLEKMQRLRIQGYSREEAERLSKPKEMDMEEVLQRIMVWQEKELRRLAKLSPKPKKCAKEPRIEEVDGLPVIHLSPVDPRANKKMATIKSD
jgi:hypothetical protein